MSTQYFCGADVSKNSFSIAVKNETFILENSFSMDSKGFESMDKILSPYKDKLLIGMESTGIYHSNLFYFLKNKSYNCFVVNPYKMRQFFNFISDNVLPPFVKSKIRENSESWLKVIVLSLFVQIPLASYILMMNAGNPGYTG